MKISTTEPINIEFTPKHYIKIHKEIIAAHILPEHRISVLTYLNYNQTWDNTVNYSPIHMIQWSGYKPNWRKRAGNKENIYEKFKKCMNWYFENGYIIDFDETNFIKNNFQSSLLNKEKLLPENNFGIIYDFELSAIMNYEISYKPLNKSIIILLLAYVRAYTWNRKTEPTGHSESSKKRKPEIFHSQFEFIGSFIGVSPRLVSKATSILQELGLLVTYRMPSFRDIEGVWHSDDIIYVCPYKFTYCNEKLRLCTKEEYDWEKELDYGIEYLRESKFYSKKFYQE